MSHHRLQRYAPSLRRLLNPQATASRVLRSLNVSERRSNVSELRFFVSGRCVPKGRPRAVARGRFVRMYTPKTTVNWEAAVRAAALAAIREHPDYPLRGAVIVDLIFSVFASRQRYRKNPLFDVAPDVDNLAKAVLDGMNEIVYRDDGQVVRLFVAKKFVLTRCLAGVSVVVRPDINSGEYR